MSYTPDAWRNFIQRISDSPPTERVCILESWMRCRDQGLDPAPERPLLRHVTEEELRARLQASQNLISAAAPIISGFSASLGTLRHVLYITDQDGIVLWSVGTDPGMSAYGLVPGFDWSERTMGTNGAGTALATKLPVAVVGPDHYELAFHESTCLASPIHVPGGEVIGAVDFSTHVGNAEAFQLTQVIRLARQIERRLAGVVLVLVVDDSEAQRYVLKRTLSECGFAVLGAASGEDAFRKAIILRPDVIVLDVSLPDVNGFELCKRIKSDPRTAGVAVVQVSAVYTNEAAKEMGYSASADAYLIHPLETRQLPEAVSRVLGLRVGGKAAA